MNGKYWTRRQVLQGAGVALSLPVLSGFFGSPITTVCIQPDRSSIKSRYARYGGFVQGFWLPKAPPEIFSNKSG